MLHLHLELYPIKHQLCLQMLSLHAQQVCSVVSTKFKAFLDIVFLLPHSCLT